MIEVRILRFIRASSVEKRLLFRIYIQCNYIISIIKSHSKIQNFSKNRLPERMPNIKTRETPLNKRHGKRTAFRRRLNGERMERHQADSDSRACQFSETPASPA
jgi:hypothetical protein